MILEYCQLEKADILKSWMEKLFLNGFTWNGQVQLVIHNYPCSLAYVW